MNIPKDNFIIRYPNGYLIGNSTFKKMVRRKYILCLIKNIFGIYISYDCNVLHEPKQEGDVWTYTIKIIRIREYFLWINYANRTWNNSK